MTILLSLIGVRVDVDSYLNGYFTPLIEINLGPSSAYTQTPFHSLRDTLDGYSVHPKCPELDYFFASRRLLDEVRSLGSPRFPTPQLNAWLVHQVSATVKAECGQPSDSSDSAELQGTQGEEEGGDGREQHLPDSGHEEDVEQGQGACAAGACAVPEETEEVKIKDEDEPIPLVQLAHSSTLEPETLLGGISALSNPPGFHGPAVESDQPWSQLLPLSASDLEDLDSLVSTRLPELDTDMSSALSEDMSLHDMGLQDMTLQHGLMSDPTAPQHGPTSPSPGLALGLASLPFSSGCNFTGNASQGMGGDLDEAVFEHINQLGLDSMDNQLLSCLDPQLLEDFDSDSGLSLECSSGEPSSPACAAYSDVDSKSLVDHRSWSPVDLSEGVWHNHSYASPPPLTYPHKSIKQETLSDDESPQFEERELSRDELRARALCLPFSVLQIVNMPVEEFLDVLESHGFSPEQVTLLRDIRRRGKNKLAAQNCRKRKLDAITGLQEEVARLQAQRDRLLRDKRLTAKTMCAVGQQIQQLTRDVLSRLRDPLGQPLNPDRYSLQCGANGRVVLVPARRPTVSETGATKADKRKKGKKQ